MNLLSALAFLSLGGAAAAFGTAPAFTRRAPSALFYVPEHFERAVECAEKYGLCDVDELDKLADELEEYKGCFFEKDQEICDKEAMDRMDVSDMLRLQRELKLRQEYLKDANLFAHDVHEEHDKHEREEFVESIQAYQSW